MKINYLENTQDFLNKESYLDSLDTYFIQDVYSMGLDEEIDIFSELPIELFAGNSKNQMNNVMQVFKKEYTRYVSVKENIGVQGVQTR